MINDSQCTLELYVLFLSERRATKCFGEILNSVKFTKEGGRECAYYGETDYKYARTFHRAQDLSLPVLKSLLHTVNVFLAHNFNSVLINYYPSGSSYIPWHSDNEVELGEQPTIATLSLGNPRLFSLRNIYSKNIVSVLLEHGSLIVMSRNTQTCWQHAILKANNCKARLNLSFRKIDLKGVHV